MRTPSIVLVLSLIACGETKPEDTDTGLDVQEPSGEDTDDTDDTQDTDDTDDTDDTNDTDTQDPDDVDQDGDGYSVNDGDCNDLDASLNLNDVDGDGQSTCDGDCNDSDETVFDGAEEVCDGQSNDCQGNASQPAGVPESEEDVDNDGYALCEDDCDDNNEFAYPGAAFNESASACMVDADGDGYGEDLGGTSSGGCCYTFELSDTYGDGWNGGMNIEVFADGSSVGSATVSTNAEANEVETTEVCISSSAAVEFIFNSGTYADEIEGTIYDIDGSVIGTLTGIGGYSSSEQSFEFSDGNSYLDGDAFYSTNAVCENEVAVTTSGTDCDDTDPAAYPGATEIWYNDVDNDCAGDVANDFDQDGDGQASDQYGGQDCDDTNTSVYTGAVEDPTDGLDNNCNGDVDEGFSIETITTGINYTDGQPLTIDVDFYGFVHIAYENNGDIEYVTNAAGGWSSADIAPTNSNADSGLHLKGQMDGLDRFHLSYVSTIGSDHDVNYMYVNTINGSWSSEDTITTAATGTLDSEFRLDMDVDSNNMPSIVWFDQMDDTPWLLDASSVNPLNGIESQLDDNCQFGACLGYTGSYISLAIDNSDTNHSVFFNNVVGQENQYNQVPNQSSSRTCNTNFLQPEVTSMFIEENGDGINNDVAIKPYTNKAGVAYMDGSTSDLMYGYNTTGGCGGWSYELVDSSNAGEFLSLVYTSDDHPYIAYYASQTADLKLAFYDGSSWVYEDVDTYGNIGKYVDMSIDSNDMIHMVYFDASTGSIKYATGQL